ncbi:MAG: MarR family transcriptional regulator [Corynebacterium glutamicum]|nr:MarR family transcriptional regulator [Corynebacterium glutamicum]
MSLYDVFFDLTRIEITLWDQLDRALQEECDIPLGSYEAVMVLHRLGPCRVQDVSRELSVTVGGTSKLIDRIEALGYCERRPNPNDRRSSLITLTASAETLMEQAEAVINRILEPLFSGSLSTVEFQLLREMLGKLRGGVSSGQVG